MSEEKQNANDPESQVNYLRILFSNQLKSPINSIQSLLNTISDGFTGEIPPKTRYFIEKAADRAIEAKSMISDLLYYQMYSQKQSASQEEFDVLTLTNELMGRYAPLASEKGISLRSDLPLHYKIGLLGDRRDLEHALRNVIENAIKYTPSDGTVSVLLSILEKERTCQLSISDTGYGIPAAEYDTIFEPFYRSIKHRANISGTGLGLAIAKKVVENHNGTISVESEENQGTTFTIILPYVTLNQTKVDLVEKKKVVIIGGVTAGPKAAARLRRLDEDLDITIIERREFLSYSACGLPSYISDKVHSPRALMSTADNSLRDVNFFASIENINVLNRTVALAINREKKTVSVQDLAKKTISEVPYDILILAIGSEFFMPQIPGISKEGVYSIHSLEEAEAVKKRFLEENAQDVYIIGGGLIGTSMAESLVETGARVTILEKEPYILPRRTDRDIARKLQTELNKKGIKVLTNIEILEIEKVKHYLSILTEEDSYYTDLIILTSGLKPNSSLAEKAGLELGRSGRIKVNEYLQTSDEHIYAIGDCAENINRITHQQDYWAFGSVSTKMGRIAANNIAGIPSTFQGSIGTAMFKIFDLNVARTGLTTQSAQEHGFDAESVVVTGLDKAHYYDHAEYITLKVIADKKTKVLLGAQGFGKGNVVARIQVLACAIMQSLTLEEVLELDLGYAPAFNNPINLAQTACLVLNNKIDRFFKTITIEEFEREKKQIKGLIDVSPPSEHTFHSIPGSINIPLENIRREEIPFDKTALVMLYSKTSSGAYKAFRFLRTKGYSNLRVLEGGYVYWER